MSRDNLVSFNINILKKEFQKELTKYINTLKYEGQIYVLLGDDDIIIDILINRDDILSVIETILKQGYIQISFMINKELNRKSWLKNMIINGYTITQFTINWNT